MVSRAIASFKISPFPLEANIPSVDSLKITKTQDFVTESGGTSNVSVQLCTVPTTNVSIALSVSNSEASISTNPYIAFPYKAKKTGTFNFEWKDDSGNTYTMKRKMTVS